VREELLLGESDARKGRLGEGQPVKLKNPGEVVRDIAEEADSLGGAATVTLGLPEERGVKLTLVKGEVVEEGDERGVIVGGATDGVEVGEFKSVEKALERGEGESPNAVGETVEVEEALEPPPPPPPPPPPTPSSIVPVVGDIPRDGVGKEVEESMGRAVRQGDPQVEEVGEEERECGGGVGVEAERSEREGEGVEGGVLE